MCVRAARDDSQKPAHKQKLCRNDAMNGGIYSTYSSISTFNGDLKIITNSRIRSIICKGPKYRFPLPIGFNHVVRKLQEPYKNFVIAGINENMLSLMP